MFVGFRGYGFQCSKARDCGFRVSRANRAPSIGFGQ